MADKGAILRALIDKGEHFVAGDCYSAITGRICEHVGFPAVYIGGHACSAFHYAVPDNGVFSQVEMIDQASRIANVLSIPLIADADTLGETVADAYHFTRRYIQQGIAGFHVEDERNPKHSKHVNGLWSIADQQARIMALENHIVDRSPENLQAIETYLRQVRDCLDIKILPDELQAARALVGYGGLALDDLGEGTSEGWAGLWAHADAVAAEQAAGTP